MDHQHSSAPTGVQINLAEHPALATAITIAKEMLAEYAGVGYDDIFALAAAHGAIRESLRILLRALGTETIDEDEAVRRSVDSRFPAAAAFLDEEREAGQ
ncbi:hypothetical protein [Streptomyces sp. MK5]|uniref:hypothetical protein n=1 Tax=Streptomyces sp. MK5 TaxID=3064253 RepID=UPI0027413E02|nr:hypothetical protein [Streptomyces sp. MK5]